MFKIATFLKDSLKGPWILFVCFTSCFSFVAFFFKYDETRICGTEITVKTDWQCFGKWGKFINILERPVLTFVVIFFFAVRPQLILTLYDKMPLIV